MTTPVATAQNFSFSGITNNPSVTTETDASAYPITLDRTGGLQNSPIHGPRFVPSIRNNLWRVGSGTGGASILAAGGTTSGFCFGNVSSSGINMDVHRLRVVPLTATAVVGVIGLEYGVAPTSTTYVTGVVASPIGNGAVPVGKTWNAVTITAMAWLQALPYFIPATTNINQPGIEVVFDNGLVIAPGFAVNVCATTSQSTNKYIVEIDWSEWSV